MTVVTPAGMSILEAARWVGGSCWLELHAHGVLTYVLASEDLDDEQRVALWRVRSNRAEVAEAWHRRLPELREFPRDTFVGPPHEMSGPTTSGVDGSLPNAVALLGELQHRYDAHVAVAVGPADGPVAATLRWASALSAQDLDELSGVSG